jgi:hypothetical protein
VDRRERAHLARLAEIATEKLALALPSKVSVASVRKLPDFEDRSRSHSGLADNGNCALSVPERVSDH